MTTKGHPVVANPSVLQQNTNILKRDTELMVNVHGRVAKILKLVNKYLKSRVNDKIHIAGDHIAEAQLECDLLENFIANEPNHKDNQPAVELAGHAKEIVHGTRSWVHV